ALGRRPPLERAEVELAQIGGRSPGRAERDLGRFPRAREVARPDVDTAGDDGREALRPRAPLRRKRRIAVSRVTPLEGQPRRAVAYEPEPHRFSRESAARPATG